MCARCKAAGERRSKWCRAGKGPIILEMLTYRYRGHSMSDPAKYRPKEEVDKMRTEHDPIEQVRARLLAKKWATEDELKKIDAEVRAIVNEAAEFATHDPEPDPSELYTDVRDADVAPARTAVDTAHRDAHADEVLMPALSPTMEKGNLAKWLKKEGDAVKSGDVIAEIETDKATMEVEAVDEGTLGKILVPEGTNDVAVNTPIAMILARGRGRLRDQGWRAAAAPQAAAGAAAEGRRAPRRRAEAAGGRSRRASRPQPQIRGRSAAAARKRCPSRRCRKAPRWSP